MDKNIKKIRGQYFTTKERVLNTLVSLIENNGNILEPSAGEGHIISTIEKKLNKNVFGVELDINKINNKICDSNIIEENFFNFINYSESYETIIGNPPFVKLKNVENQTINILPEKIPANGNLYYFFIKYCVSLLKENGELIFIVPKEWLYNVSSKFTRDYLSQNGNFTHFIDCGEEKLFEDADVPALCIFRYQKGYNGDLKYYETLDNFYSNIFVLKKAIYSNTIIFTNNLNNSKKISDYFDVKVGLVTGAEKIFKIDKSSNFDHNYLIDIVSTNKKKYKYIFLENTKDIDSIPENIKNYLLNNKKKLLNRKIKKFDEKNWWKYGALRNIKLMNSEKNRIYGLMKTRNSEIFWSGKKFEYFGGGVIGLFLKEGLNIDLEILVNHLNSDEFKKIMNESNMYTNNKVTITPSVLANLPFPFLT